MLSLVVSHSSPIRLWGQCQKCVSSSSFLGAVLVFSTRQLLPLLINLAFCDTCKGKTTAGGIEKRNYLRFICDVHRVRYGPGRLAACLFLLTIFFHVFTCLSFEIHDTWRVRNMLCTSYVYGPTSSRARFLRLSLKFCLERPWHVGLKVLSCVS